jgi:class 3 adenylate cyclase
MQGNGGPIEPYPAGGSSLPTRRLVCHRSILVVDIAGFGRRHRHAQVAARHGMYRVVREALAAARIHWTPGPCDDTGDGLRILLPEGTCKSVLAHPLPSAMAAALHRLNTENPHEEQLRLRLAIHAGEVYYDGDCAVGSGVIEAFRLVDATQLRLVLTQSPGPLVLAVSDHFYREVVHGDPHANPDAYVRIRVPTKEGAVLAWITLPGEPKAEVFRAVERARPQWWRRLTGGGAVAAKLGSAGSAGSAQ